MTSHIRLFLFFALFTLPARAQGLVEYLQQLVERPAVSGYEAAPGGITDLVRSQIKAIAPDLEIKSDNMGNLYVILAGLRGAGPKRLIVAPLDEPGYVVSRITADGYLRLQRLPQQAPNALFDQLHFAQPVLISTRSGKRVPGVIAGLSVHLQPGRRDAPRMSHPDEMYVDIGAKSADEVRTAGVDLLDPLTIDREMQILRVGDSNAHLAGMAVGDRFGAAALLALLGQLKDRSFTGSVTLAFVVRQWVGSRGTERLLEETQPDEMIYVGRLFPPRGGRDGKPPAQAPRAAPGSGVLISTSDAEKLLSRFAAELQKKAADGHIPAVAEPAGPLPQFSLGSSRGRLLPARYAQVGIAIAWPVTPAEMIKVADLVALLGFLEISVRPTEVPTVTVLPVAKAPAEKALSMLDKGPSMADLLAQLVETYGASGHEAAVRKKVSALLPPWAKPEADAAGNLVLKLGVIAGGSPARKLLFVAHMDEIGYEVKSIAPDGRLEVEALGGGVQHYFAGHPVLLHTAKGVFPGVLELPAGWDAPGFEWPRDRAAQDMGRVDVGVRTAEEAEEMGIRVGDWATIPKKYRPLLGTRANGRSFDDRVGCAALIAAAWALGPQVAGREVTLMWSTQEEVGLLGAAQAAQRLATAGESPDYVFAIDTFVSSDSPLETDRFGDAPIGHGFVVRAVDNSNIAPRELVDRVLAMARANGIPAQYGVTGGGNDGSVFTRFGPVDVPLAWPLRYSHSPAEVIDVRDAEALGRIIAVLARGW